MGRRLHRGAFGKLRVKPEHTDMVGTASSSYYECAK